MPKWCTFLVTIERQESGVNRKTRNRHSAAERPAARSRGLRRGMGCASTPGVDALPRCLLRSFLFPARCALAPQANGGVALSKLVAVWRGAIGRALWRRETARGGAFRVPVDRRQGMVAQRDVRPAANPGCRGREGGTDTHRTYTWQTHARMIITSMR